MRALRNARAFSNLRVPPKIPQYAMKDVQYILPQDRVALTPQSCRGQSKLLAVNQTLSDSAEAPTLQDMVFSDVIDLLPSDVHLLMNESRVIAARLWTEGGAEVMMLNSESIRDPAESMASLADGQQWRCMIRGTQVPVEQNQELEIGHGVYVRVETIHSVWEEEDEAPGVEASIIFVDAPDKGRSLGEVLSKVGDIPIPPYLNRDTNEEDEEGYQTVYASTAVSGSVAAPTAGLHFTDDILCNLQARGIGFTKMALHVSAGTFKPVTVGCISEHDMHEEFFNVQKEALYGLIEALRAGKKIVAVGTTSVRLIETLYWMGVRRLRNDEMAESATLGQWDAYNLQLQGQEAGGTPLPDAAEALGVLLQNVDGKGSASSSSSSIQGSTALCVTPGYDFRVVTGGLITNFHQPDSTLMLLVAAFLRSSSAGVHSVYNHALANDYTFLSYGDSSIIANFPWKGNEDQAKQSATSAAPWAAQMAAEYEARQPQPLTEKQQKVQKEQHIPQAGDAVLLHSCCAPCSGAMVESMVEKDLDVTIYFYNPNIHPREEYETRKNENKRYAAELGVPFIDADYDSDVNEWYSRAKGMEWSPERGDRCTMCFDMRMERTALHAKEHGFSYITTTNATSRWKDEQQVDDSGHRAAAHYENVHYWQQNWRDDTMTQKKYEINAEQKFYKQEYCGCSFSLRDVNAYRRSIGEPHIKIPSQAIYEDAQADAEEESVENVEAFFEFDSTTDRDNFREAKKLEKMYKTRRKTGGADNNW